MKRWLGPLLFSLISLPFASCAHKTRLDCIELCRNNGLRFVEVVSGTSAYDPVERELQQVDVCRCR